MALNFEAFRSHKSKDTPTRENTGNVHLKVEEYVRNERSEAIAVRGTNLKTGTQAEIRLADPETFAKLYGNPQLDISERISAARDTLKNRPPLTDFASSRGNKRVPPEGIISISDVRIDRSTEQQYGRWALGVVNDPNGEAAIGGLVDIKKIHITPKTELGQSFEPFDKAVINVVQPKLAIPSSDVTKENLDKMLSGKLEGTEAPMRTKIVVTLPMGADGSTRSVGLESPYRLAPKEGSSFRGLQVNPGIEAVLERKTSGIWALASAVIAGKVGIPLEKLNFSDKVNEDQKAAIVEAYEQAKSGELKFSVTPGAEFEVFDNMKNALFGLKQDKDGNTTKAPWTREGEMLNRGYFEGLVGVRFVPASNDQLITEPFAKTVMSDAALPKKGSDHFLYMNLDSVGQQVFSQVHDSDPAASIPSHDTNPDLGEPATEDMSDIGYEDHSATPAM